MVGVNFFATGHFFWNFCKKGEGSDFFHKKEGIDKIGGFRVFVCVCVCVFIYTISISIFCVS